MIILLTKIKQPIGKPKFTNSEISGFDEQDSWVIFRVYFFLWNKFEQPSLAISQHITGNIIAKSVKKGWTLDNFDETYLAVQL